MIQNNGNKVDPKPTLRGMQSVNPPKQDKVRHETKTDCPVAKGKNGRYCILSPEEVVAPIWGQYKGNKSE